MQNLVLPYVRRADLLDLWKALDGLELASANIGLVGEVAPWGRGPYSQPVGALGWIQSHPWAALAIAAASGFVLHQTTKGGR